MEQLWLTALLNRLFAGPVTSFLRALHIEPQHPQAPISNSFAMELVVFASLLAKFLLIRSRLSVDNPGEIQHLTELFHGLSDSPAHEITSPDSHTFLPLLPTPPL